jgi:long-subunit acyl-CoA synthetase (AMP-forming)
MFGQLPDCIRQSGPPSQTLLQSGKRRITRSECLLEVEALATRTQKLGLRCVALYADNGIDWIVADLACQLAEIRLTPVPLFFSDTQVGHAISNSGADALLTDQKGVTRFFDGDITTARDQRTTGSTQLYLLNPDCSALLPEGTQKISFTSGTTGTPKGVCLSSDQQLAVARAIASVVDINRPRHLCVLPLSTLLENLAGVYSPLLAGGTVIAPPLTELGLTGSSHMDARRLLECIANHQPHTLIVVPEIINALVLATEGGWSPPSSLQFVAVGGGKVAPELLRRARHNDIPAFEGYGRLGARDHRVASNITREKTPLGVGCVLGPGQSEPGPDL